MDTIKQGYTRVSSILAQWDKFGHIDKTVLANKAAIGTRVHEGIKNHIDGVFTPLDIACEGYFNSYIVWEKTANFNIVKSEERYYCDKLMITGQVDAIITLPGDTKPCIVDFKTSVQESPKIWPLQAGFYRHLAELSGLDLSNRMIFIRLDKKGGFPTLHEYTFSKELWNVCMCAWTCYRHLNS